MPSRKFGHNSNYDESGMPLGTTTADYDNADEVRKNMVKSTYVEPLPLNNPEYQPRQISKKVVGQDSRRGLPYGVKGFNSSMSEGEGFPDPDVEFLDIEDPANRKEMLVTEAVSKGFDEVPELPKTEKQENVDAVKEDINDDKGDDFLKELEKDQPDAPVEVKAEKEAEKKDDSK